MPYDNQGPSPMYVLGPVTILLVIVTMATCTQKYQQRNRHLKELKMDIEKSGLRNENSN